MRWLLRYIFEKFFEDFLRIYRKLPPNLKRNTLRVFAAIVILAVLEIGAILSISFLTVSIAAPEKLRELGPIAWLFAHVPFLEALCADQRLFALIISSSVVLLVLTKNALTSYVNLLTARLGENISLYVGETVFRQYLYTPYINHLSGNSQRMFQGLSWRTQLGQMITYLMTVYAYAAISFALIMTLVSATPGAVLFVVAAVAATAVLVYKTLKGRIDAAGKGSAEFTRQENAATMNAMHGIRETLIYRQQHVFFDHFREASKGGMPGRTFLMMSTPIPTLTLETVGFMAIPVTLWVMYAIQDASMARITGVLTMIMLICWRLLPLLNRSLSSLVAVRGLRHSALDCLALMEEARADPAPEPPTPDPDFTLSRDMALDHVVFRYPKAEVDCLHDISFVVPFGTRFGIVGQSGAGKSSIVGILSGLVDPTSGRMLVDGKELTPSEQAAYRMHVGYVPQTPYILAGTLAENVAFSQWGRPWDDEKVERVCRMAELDIVRTRGITMTVGSNGAGLSGGQAQRLSIARALYADPSILIMDEATSSLDSGVEAAIMHTIFALPKNITTIIIAHRLTTVQACDTILWLDEGRVVAIGPPETVLPDYQAFLDRKALGQSLDCAA
jgi:ABC-type multidrug transport system fused ATPase/permease subunit